jgi:hypothetical protein
MRERPIIFTAESVRAILDGTKTQTRRVMREPWKVQLPHPVHGDGPFRDTRANAGIYIAHHNRYGAVSVEASNGRLLGVKPAEFEWVCPYGQVGDHLWVRETWVEWGGELVYLEKSLDKHGNEDADSKRCRLDYGVTWKSPMFMPRWASRITLEIVNIKVQRVQDISDDDAMAEGVYEWYKQVQLPHEGWSYWSPVHGSGAAQKFGELWDSINARRGYPWDSNCWVWAIEFRRVTP